MWESAADSDFIAERELSAWFASPTYNFGHVLSLWLSTLTLNRGPLDTLLSNPTRGHPTRCLNDASFALQTLTIVIMHILAVVVATLYICTTSITAAPSPELHKRQCTPLLADCNPYGTYDSCCSPHWCFPVYWSGVSGNYQYASLFLYLSVWFSSAFDHIQLSLPLLFRSW